MIKVNLEFYVEDEDFDQEFSEEVFDKVTESLKSIGGFNLSAEKLWNSEK